MPEDSISVTITVRERDLLLNETIAVDEEILSKLRIAEIVNGRIRFSILPNDFDLLLDNIAFEANHASSTKKEADFERLSDHLEDLYDRHFLSEKGSLPDIDRQVELPAGDRFGNDRLRQTYPAKWKTPKNHLGGLTVSQVVELCQRGWWASEAPIRLEASLSPAELSDSRFLYNARLFLNAIIESGGAPITATGNLARKFVGEMLESMSLEEGLKHEILAINKVVNEMDFWSLHRLRLVCVLGKLIKKHQKRFVATKSGRFMAGEEKSGQLFAHLFDAHFAKFNLAYATRFPDIYETVQRFFPYSLYRLRLMEIDKEYAITEMPTVLLPPTMAAELKGISEHFGPEQYIRHHFILPLEDLGLLTVRRVREKYIEKERFFRKTALFDQFIQVR